MTTEQGLTLGGVMAASSWIAPGEPISVPAVEPGELLVFRGEKLISAEAAVRIREQLELLVRRMAAGERIAAALDPGCSLEVVRSGGWIYCYEGQPTAEGIYEVAFEATEGGKPVRWVGEGRWRPNRGWTYPGRFHAAYLDAEPAAYAYRPAPVPPPVRRAPEGQP